MKFVCCFCCSSIEPLGDNPCSLTIETGYNKQGDQESEQRWQGFWCHLDCFKDKVDSALLPNMHYLLGVQDELE